MGWFQVDFSSKGHMSRPWNWYSKEFSQISIEICLKKMCYSNRSWFWGTFHKIDVFVFFWVKNKPQLKFFYRDMVYITLIHLLRTNLHNWWFMYIDISISLRNGIALPRGFSKITPTLDTKSLILVLTWAKCRVKFTLHEYATIQRQSYLIL